MAGGRRTHIVADRHARRIWFCRRQVNHHLELRSEFAVLTLQHREPAPLDDELLRQRRSALPTCSLNASGTVHESCRRVRTRAMRSAPAVDECVHRCQIATPPYLKTGRSNSHACAVGTGEEQQRCLDASADVV
jgi:hypothetical protein